MSRGTRAASGLLIALLVAALASTNASAHTKSTSYSIWTFDREGAHVELRIKLLELTREPPGHVWRATLPRDLVLLVNDTPCAAGDATRSNGAPVGWAVFHWRIRCAQSGPRTIRSRLLAEVATAHTHFVRLAATDDGSGEIRERLLVTGRDPVWVLAASPGGAAPAATIGSYVALGVTHIATGWDHLAFVLALLLLAGSLREVAGLVTGFTIAHSLTLGLAVMGLVRPENTAVEVLIGFSIALVAAENGWLLAARERRIPAAVALALVVATTLSVLGFGVLHPVAWLGLLLFTGCHFALLHRAERPARLRSALAFAFGLLHGFGFAGFLMELELPAARLLPALFGFNIGVELGQLVLVALAWPLLVWLARRFRPAHRLFAEAASAAIFGLGLFWLVGRNF